LKKCILDKRKDLTEDLHLITLAEDKLQTQKNFDGITTNG
jgi:hypothetical protein